jgi:hypothetical protein
MEASTTPLEVTYLRTISLKPDPRNPRIHSDKQVRQIAQSIESFGFNVPLLIDEQHKVIAGHGRLLAARKLGWETVPAIQLSHLSESQRTAFLIADNRLTENSSWDERMLGEHLKILSELELDFDLEAIGFEIPEIDLLIDGLDAIPEVDPDDGVPVIAGSAVSVFGDLWQLGKRRVLCGNSFLIADYERLMGDEKADLVITDPPYNVVIHGHATGNGSVHHREFGMASGEMSSIEFTDFLRKAMIAARDHSADGSLAYYFMDWRHMTEILSAGQEFNTTSSMGRLTLNVLLSFAQFEREVTGERIRDKVAASKKKGMWMGGFVPLGYNNVNQQLVVNPEEADVVRSIFRRYLDLKSVTTLQEELRGQGVRSKQRTTADGRQLGGAVLSRGTVYHLLSNQVYIGKTLHKGALHPGKHEPILDLELWSQVSNLLKSNRITRRRTRNVASGRMLIGRLKTESGLIYTPTHASKGGRRYFYYTLRCKEANETEKILKCLPAIELEDLVFDALRRFFADSAGLADTSEGWIFSRCSYCPHASANGRR